MIQAVDNFGSVSPSRCFHCWGTDNRDRPIVFGIEEALHGYRDGDPVIRQGVEANFGTLALCHLCADQVTSARGGLSPVEAEKLWEKLREANARLDQLEGELEVERRPEAKVVSISELQKLLREDAPAATGPEPDLPEAA